MLHLMPNLPEELITEILLRLPVKSLLKFRSVSKSWLGLISNPEFIKTHLSVSAHNKEYTHHRIMLIFSEVVPQGGVTYSLKDCSVESLFDGSDMEVCDLDYPGKKLFRSSFRSWSFKGSVNGLVCSVDGSFISFVSEKRKLVIWNPCTRKYKKLPDFGTNLKDAYYCVFSFGYDPLHDDYKVVGCVYSYLYPYESPSFEVKIYSLKDDSWRSTHYPVPDGVRLLSRGTFASGKLHWVNYRERNIVSIDLADEKWGNVERPCRVEKHDDLLLGVLGNNLYAIPKGHYYETHIDVWVMKEYGVKESWTKLFTFNGHVPLPPHYISTKDEILLVFAKEFLLYNLKDESTRYLEFPKLKSSYVQEIYLESLVSPLIQNQGRTQQE